MRPLRVACVSVIPSPYQRDLLAALARQPHINLNVFYQEASAPDHSPWASEPLRPFEHELPGRAWGPWSNRLHWNWPLPRAEDFNVWILNTIYHAPTGQYLMRWHLRHVPWIFWGERLGDTPPGWVGAAKELAVTALAGADMVAAVGQSAVADYRRRLPGMPVASLPYHTDLESFTRAAAQADRAPGGPVVILFCGQMIERKGIDLLLEAFARLVTAGRDVRLLLVGGGLGERLEALPPSARERVDAAGFRQPRELPGLFARADIFVLPSRREGWGVVVNQAIGAGLPVVCSDAVGARDLVRPGWNGEVVPVGDASALTSALDRLVADGDLRRMMSANAAASAPSWSPEAGAARWASLLREVVGRQFDGVPPAGHSPRLEHFK